MSHRRWTFDRFLQGWEPNRIPDSLRFPAVIIPPPPPATFSTLVDDVLNILIDDEGNNLVAQD